MAKRRMRRTSQIKDDGRSTADSLTEAARDVSINSVKIVTDTAKAALEGMREIGRTMASMAAPAARQTVKTANDVTRAAMDSTRQLTRSAADTARGATRSAVNTARRVTRSTRRKSGKRRAA